MKQFILVTKYDFALNHPCLLQILFSQHSQTYIILIEPRYLPNNTCVLFQQIQFLLSIILSPSNLLQSWGEIKNELKYFSIHELFTLQQIERTQVVNIQQKFKRWFDTIFAHTDDCDELYDHLNDYSTCICVHRPLNHSYDEWSLDMAIAFVYEQYFDTSFTHSNWNIGLYFHVQVPSSAEHLNHTDEEIFYLQLHCEKQCRYILNEYVVKECSAIKKLAAFLQNSLLRKHKETY